MGREGHPGASGTGATSTDAHVLEGISDAFYLLDADWRFTYVNRAAEELLRRRRDQLLGTLLTEQFPKAHRTAMPRLLTEAAATGRPREFELPPDPLNTWYRGRIVPTDAGLAVTFQDISREIETEERLQRIQRLETVGQMAASVAHDFNNLLMVMAGHTRLLRDELSGLPGLSGTAQEGLAAIRDATDRATELTQQLLTFSGQHVLHPVAIDLSVLLRRLHPMMSALLGSDIAIRLELPAAPPRVHFDPGKLEQVLLNLVTNARDAMPEGGRLTIAVGNDPGNDPGPSRPDAPPPAPPHSGSVRLSVTDTGSGMASEVLTQACDPFFTTKSAGTGTGLGLTTSFAILRRGRGDLVLESTPGQGTTATLFLPHATPLPETDDAPPPTDDPAHGPVVLLVETDARQRSLTARILEERGLTTHAVGDVTEALAFDGLADCQLLLVDVVLVGMTGQDLLAELRVRRPGLPVVFVSTQPRRRLVGQGLLGVDDPLLVKPFSASTLVRTVETALAHR